MAFEKVAATEKIAVFQALSLCFLPPHQPHTRLQPLPHTLRMKYMPTRRHITQTPIAKILNTNTAYFIPPTHILITGCIIGGHFFIAAVA